MRGLVRRPAPQISACEELLRCSRRTSMTSINEQPIPAARPVIGEEEIEAAVRVLRSGRVVQGPEVAAFEEGFSELVDGRHCVAVNSGTSALHMLLLALGIGPGDEVIVPSFSFAASANAVRLVGADVVFADIEPGSFGLDPAAVEAVVEDACQAHAAALNGTPVGAFGEGGTFSFYPTKNMHALEGGMVTTADAELARTLRLLRNQGMEQRYANEIVGANMRMTDVAAAIGRVQLTQLAEWTEQRRANAAYLDAHITAANVTKPPVAEGARHVYHQYTIRVQGDREAAMAKLTEAGIGNAVYYPTPIHRLRPFWEPDQKAGRNWDLPETERAAAEVVSLPVHPSLSESDLERIVSAVNELGENL